MKATLLVVAAAGVLGAGLVYGQSGADLVKAKGCLTCHEADQKKVGPSYKDIAAKYKGDKGAAASLTAKLKEGKGHAKAAATDDEIKSMVQYVLSRK